MNPERTATQGRAPAGDAAVPQSRHLFERVQSMMLPGQGSPQEPETGPEPAPGEAEHEARGVKSVMASSLPRRWHPLPVPNGWYAAVGTEDLGPCDVISFVAVDRDLVAFRDESGAAHVFDAHCPHLGAHLGGGRVAGESLSCPYHGWRFGVDGACVDIPYCDSKIPARARVRSYRVDEKDGFVYFWYHAADAEPTYEIPKVDEVGDPDWTDAHPWRFELVAALQEMGENNVDYAHLRYVHRREVVPSDTSEFQTDGPMSWVVEQLPDGPTFTRHSYGPGFALLRVPGVMTMLAATTPIDRGTCRLRWHFLFPRSMAHAADALIDGVTGKYGLQADIPIWRDKVYRDRPVLVKGDGPVAEFRRWYSQFYEGN